MGAPADLIFQSIAGSQKGNEAFGFTAGTLAEARELALKEGTATGPNVLYFETGQGSELSSEAHNGWDQVTMEARCYGFARHFQPFLVNTVVGFIGPEYLYNAKQVIRAGLEDHFMGKLTGVPMGCDACYTNHMKADQNDIEDLAVLLTAAGCNYFMGIPHGDDVMLNYQTTGYRETAALRELFGLTAIRPFQDWLEKMGFVENGKLTPWRGTARCCWHEAAGGRRGDLWSPEAEPDCGVSPHQSALGAASFPRGKPIRRVSTLNEKELRALVERMVADLMGQAPTPQVKAADYRPMEPGPAAEGGELTDLAAIDLRRLYLVQNPKNGPAFLALKAKTPARLGMGRAGARYKTETMLRMRCDHAAAQDSVFSHVSEDFVKGQGYVPLQTLCKDKDEYLTRPDKGRRFDETNQAVIRKALGHGPKAALVVGDGLSSAAIEANAADCMEAIRAGLKGCGIDPGPTLLL